VFVAIFTQIKGDMSYKKTSLRVSCLVRKNIFVVTMLEMQALLLCVWQYQTQCWAFPWNSRTSNVFLLLWEPFVFTCTP